MTVLAESPHWEVFAPIAFVAIGALMALVLDTVAEARRRNGRAEHGHSRRGPLLALVSSVALVAAVLSAWSSLGGAVEPAFDARSGLFILDRLTSVGIIVLASAALLTLWLSVTLLSIARLDHAPFHALVLLASAGLFVAVGSGHLAFLYVGLELAAVCFSLLAGYDARRSVSHEAGMKLHLAQGFASGLMLFGITLLYGATGELSYAGLWAGLDASDWLGLSGLGLLISGLLFKLGLVPFHQWVSDVFEGLPPVVSGYLAVAMPVTAVIVLLRFMDEAIPPDFAPISDLLRLLAVLSIVVGHGLALAARTIKRMLASAGIAHAGHLALGLACASAEAFEAVLFYAFVYAFTMLGAHGLAASLTQGGREVESIDDLAGLGRTRPWVAAGLSLFLLSLAGLPGTGGFWAIFNLFSATVAEGAVVSSLIALIGVAVSWRYLLAIPHVMLVREVPRGPGGPPRGRMATLSTAEIVVLSVCAAVVLYLGWQPAPGLADVMSGLVR